MKPFWNTQTVATALNLKIQSPSQEITHITTDSRAVTPGCLFVAIQGDAFDGHTFISQAIEKGAKAIITEKPITGQAEIFQVHSTLDAIRTLAHHYRKQFQVPMIGVVGAVGKTTTKELISSIAHGKFKHVHKTDGSQNGFLGIAITLLAMSPEADLGVIEIGIDDIGAMDQHLALVEPTHVILTATGPEHLHQLKTVDIASEEELKAFDYAAKKNLPMAINVSDEYVSPWFVRHQFSLTPDFYQTYSLHASHAPLFLGSYQPERGELLVKTKNWSETFDLPLPGEHHAHNLLAAVTLASILEMTPAQMKSGLAQFKTAYGRTEIHALKLTDGQAEIIGDHYNSNPTSASAALKLLNEKKSHETHAVLGDMLELGDGEEAYHRGLANAIIENGIRKVWLYGTRMQWLQDELQNRGFRDTAHFKTHEELLNALKPSIHANDRILIKGSRGMKMETVLKGLLP